MLLEGVTIPLITPLNADESLDFHSLERVLEYTLSGGADAIFVLGSSGEYANLSRATKDGLVRTAAEIIAGRAAFFVGIAQAGTRGTIEEGQYMQDLGLPIDAFVVLPPFYYSHNPTELVVHFTSIANQLDHPIIMYNIPGLVKHTISPQVVKELAGHPNIIGIKNTSTDMEAFHQLMQIRQQHADTFRVSQGDLPNALECLLHGADGITLGVGSLAPHWCRDLFEAGRDGDRLRGQQALDHLMYIDPVGIDCSWFAGLKLQCSLLGLCQSHLSQPFQQAGSADEHLLRQKLVDMHMLDGSPL